MDRPADFEIDRAGIVAQSVSVANQTINIRGRPEWIQTLSLEDLKVARERLLRASRRHESRALAPLLAPLVVAALTGAVLSAWLKASHIAVANNADRATIAFLLLLVAAPVWMALYDMRRRHRRAVDAAEKRWAEIDIEICLREDMPVYETRVERALKQWRQRRLGQRG